MSSGLDGQVAVVTGGSRGIGLAVALLLRSRGAKVCVTGRKQPALDEAVRRLGGEHAMAIAGRSDDADHQSDVMSSVVDRWDAVDILVNNAAVNPVFGPLATLERSAADKIWSVNVLACHDWVRAFQSVRADDAPGAVVNVSSFASVRPSPGIGMYGVSKTALLQLTRQLALELAPHVRVNAVVPALIGTEFSMALHDAADDVAQGYPLARIDGGLALTGGV